MFCIDVQRISIRANNTAGGTISEKYSTPINIDKTVTTENERVRNLFIVLNLIRLSVC